MEEYLQIFNIIEDDMDRFGQDIAIYDNVSISDEDKSFDSNKIKKSRDKLFNLEGVCNYSNLQSFRYDNSDKFLKFICIIFVLILLNILSCLDSLQSFFNERASYSNCKFNYRNRASNLRKIKKKKCKLKFLHSDDYLMHVNPFNNNIDTNCVNDTNKKCPIPTEKQLQIIQCIENKDEDNTLTDVNLEMGDYVNATFEKSLVGNKKCVLEHPGFMNYSVFDVEELVKENLESFGNLANLSDIYVDDNNRGELLSNKDGNIDSRNDEVELAKENLDIVEDFLILPDFGFVNAGRCVSTFHKEVDNFNADGDEVELTKENLDKVEDLSIEPDSGFVDVRKCGSTFHKEVDNFNADGDEVELAKENIDIIEVLSIDPDSDFVDTDECGNTFHKKIFSIDADDDEVELDKENIDAAGDISIKPDFNVIVAGKIKENSNRNDTVVNLPDFNVNSDKCRKIKILQKLNGSVDTRNFDTEMIKENADKNKVPSDFLDFNAKADKCRKTSHKRGDSKDVENSEIHLMEQLLSQRNFHIKAPVVEVYMVPSSRYHPQHIHGIPWHKFKSELGRLITYYQYPHNAKKSALMLAEAGFAYCGTGKDVDDQVICYFCCAIKQNWHTSDDIDTVHRILSPNCPMVTGTNCTNIPMKEISDEDGLFKQLSVEKIANFNIDGKKKARQNLVDIDSMNESHLTDEIQPQQVAANVGNSTNNLSKQPAMNVQTGNSASALTSSTNTEPARSTAGQSLASNLEASPILSMPSNNRQINTPNLSVGEHTTPTVSATQRPINGATSTNTRQTSSSNQEPINGGLSTSLPQAVTQSERLVQASLPNRQQTTEQVSHANQTSQNLPRTVVPNTPVLNQSMPTSQSTTTSQSAATTQENSQSETVRNQNTPNVSEKGPTYGQLGIITERPKRFEYAVRATRFASFEPWPRDHHLKKSELADAGFYYAGYGDCARCFYCGGGLRNWEDEDDVWVEHARWFPKCAYIKQTLGQQFVEAVQELNKNCDRISFQMVVDKIGSSAASLQLGTKSMPLKRDPAVLTVKYMGFSEEDAVSAATSLKESGILSADELYKKLMDQNKTRVITETMPRNQPSKYSSDPELNKSTLKKLKEDNSQLRQQTVCKICMDKEVAVVFLPCGHFVSCTDCASAMKDCPVCRKQVRGIVRAFIG